MRWVRLQRETPLCEPTLRYTNFNDTPLDNGSAIQGALKSLTNQSTVPNIFSKHLASYSLVSTRVIVRFDGDGENGDLTDLLCVTVGGKHLGGCDDTYAAKSSGKLKQMLSAAGVTGAKL